MTRLLRIAARLSAALLLLALLVGVPAAVFMVVGVPWPSWTQLDEAWSVGRVGDSMVLHLGATVFAALWLWFAATALTELWVVLGRRAGAAPLPELPAGPSGWVRALVRLAVVSSVGIGATVSGFVATHRPTAAFATADETATLLGQAHRVEVGDCYWTIADDHLATVLERDPTPVEVADYTEWLIEVNGPMLGHLDRTLVRPGELVVFPGEPAVEPAVAPAVEDDGVVAPTVERQRPAPVVEPAITDQWAGPAVEQRTPAAPVAPLAKAVAATHGSTLAPFAAGLGTALLLSAGALGVLEQRRRRTLRGSRIGDHMELPSLAAVRTEMLLRALSPAERLARLDLAVRAAAPALAAQGACVTAAVLGDGGDVRLFLRGAAVPTAAYWSMDLHGGTWLLPPEVDMVTLAAVAREHGHPCPALVHLGSVFGGGECFVDLEAIGVLSVVSPHAPALLRTLAASLAVSPFVDAARVVTTGVGDVVIGDSTCEAIESLDAALDAAAVTLGATPLLARTRSPFELRNAGGRGEAWEPAIVIAAGTEGDPALATLAAVAPAASGLGVVVDARVPGVEWSISVDRIGHVLEPLGLRIQPVGVSAEQVADLGALLHTAGAPLVRHADVVPIGTAPRVPPARPFEEPEWSLMVRVLGQVDVVSRDGCSVAFERSKAQELVVWLSHHRDRPTRMGARTALWDLDVRDATFANVVSDARRALARACAPSPGDDWIARTLTEDLPLHDQVVTDADLLAARVAHARGLAPADAIDVLRPGVELIAGSPFAGTLYLWTDAEGISSSMVLLATGAAIELAQHCLALDDVEGAFWATAQGLKVLPGHEELIAIRMRAHAMRGDLAGVRHEWESYERALAADPWSAADPAPKLVALRRELLGVSHGRREREGA